jgi:hypothetical protein
MREKAAVILWTVCIFVATCCALGKNTNEPSSTIITDLTAPAELVRHEQEFSSAYLEPARMGGEPGVAVIFDGTEDLHYYAKAETAPAAGFELKVEAKSDDFRFGQALFPKWQIFTDPIGSKVEVYAGHFTVFVPMKAETDTAPTEATVIDHANVKVKISGLACTSMVCLPPFEKTLQARFDWNQRNSWKEISIETPGDTDTAVEAAQGPGYSTWFALALGFGICRGIGIEHYAVRLAGLTNYHNANRGPGKSRQKAIHNDGPGFLHWDIAVFCMPGRRQYHLAELLR